MIEISHAQARRLISAQIDELNLPEAQWATLHAHLENCPECIAYRDQLRFRERELRRSLRDRWLTVEGPHPATGEIILAARGATLAWRGAFRKAGAGALGLVLLLMAWMGWQSQSETRQQAAAPVQLTATPIPTPTATAIPTYRGQIVYEAPGVGGQMDIFLLNSGVEPVNLTDHPAQDIAPTWSPDGEWLAFFSDRSGKREIWVMHVSGASLTQITDDPQVDWSWPISWSPDGRMLTLVGTGADMGYGVVENGRVPGESQVYLIPLDGSDGPIALGYTKGAKMVAFAPGEQRMLAFAGQTEWWSGTPVIFSLDDRLFVPVDDYSKRESYQVSALAWSLAGDRLLYLLDGPLQDGEAGINTTSSLRITSFTSGNMAQPATTATRATVNYPVGAISRPGFTGILDEIAFQHYETGLCTRLVMDVVSRKPSKKTDSVHTLCVEGDIPVTNWRTANKSVIVKARRLGEKVPGLYALYFNGTDVTAERLIDLDNGSMSVQLRPKQDRMLAIDPTPARTLPQPPTADPPGEGYAEILFTTKSGDRTFIEAMRPDGTRRRLVNQSIGYNGCPVWSPDRKQIAFLSNRDLNSRNNAQVFIVDAAGRQPVAVEDFMIGIPTWQCPQWSPDGEWLLAVELGRMNVIRTERKSGEQNYFWFTSGASFGYPSWMPDGRLMIYEMIENPFGIKVRAGRPENIPTGSQGIDETSLLDWPALFTMNGLTPFLADVSDSGDSMVFAISNAANTEITLNLTKLDGRTYYVLGKITAGKELLPIPQVMHRLPDGNMALIYRGYADSQYKTAIYIYDMQTGEQRWLARLTDSLFEAHWSTDGRYVMLNTDGGLWALDIPAAQRGEAGPVWIADIGSDPFSWEE